MPTDVNGQAMTAEVFAEWLRETGYRVIRTPSTYWYNRGPGFLQAFPFFDLITPPGDELDAALRQAPAVALRFSAPLGFSWGTCSYHTALQDRSYGLKHLSKKNRNIMRQSAGTLTVQRIPFERLAGEGWEIYRETLKRQRRCGEFSRAQWERRCTVARRLPGFEAWGALLGNVLTSVVLAFQCNGCYYILEQYSRTEFRRQPVNLSLVYELARDRMAAPEVHTVHYGLQSLDAGPSLDEFKFRAGFRMFLVKQCVRFRPPFDLLARKPLLSALRWTPQPLLRLARAEKVGGLVRLRLQGLRPPEEQDLLVRLRLELERSGFLPRALP